MFATLSRLLASLLGLAIVALVAGGVWLGYRGFYAKDIELRRVDAQLAAERKRSQQLADEVQAQQRRIERLETAIRLLKIDHRVAYLDVVEQRRKPGGDELETTVDFVEVDDAGRAVSDPKRVTLDGDLVYIEYWVIKFEDTLVEQGDPLHGASLCLFRRIFGEFQEPREGHALDVEGAEPRVYGDSVELTAFQRELWKNFWEYANDPAKARAAGVRAAHGEAPNVRVQPNKRYRIELRASGGLSIKPEDAPQPPGEAT